MKRITLIFLLLCSLLPSIKAQDDQPWLEAGGYASWLHNVIFEKPSERWINSSMLHNRLNFTASAGNRLDFTLGVRNRLVTGDMLIADPGYAASFGYDPGWIDMSWNIIDEQSVILNTFIDRAYATFRSGNLEITAGRQRINWSQSLVWNPNDIFNTYSYFDFDYTERPGSDAVRVVYAPGPSSAAELAVKAGEDGKVTAAALYRFSLAGADLQFLAGETDSRMFTLGTGWSAMAGKNGFRGEATWFIPMTGFDEPPSTLIVTAGADRSFSEKVNALVQVMYSNNPVEPENFTDLYRGGFTARELAFSEFSAIAQFSYLPMPLLTLSVAGIWYPDLDGFYAGPSVDFSMAENVDFSLVWQYFASRISGETARVNLGFLRFKYSF